MRGTDKVIARKNDFGRDPRRNPKNRTRKWIFEGNVVVNKPPHPPGADWTHIQRSLAVDACVEPFFDCSAPPQKKRDLPKIALVQPRKAWDFLGIAWVELSKDWLPIKIPHYTLYTIYIYIYICLYPINIAAPLSFRRFGTHKETLGAY